MKSFHPPIPITVTENSDGRPVSFSYRKRMEKVSLVRRRWSFSAYSEGWSKKEMLREYFLLETLGGTTCEIYCDFPTRSWYLNTIFD